MHTGVPLVVLVVEEFLKSGSFRQVGCSASLVSDYSTLYDE
jgi:hypothetical protein